MREPPASRRPFGVRDPFLVRLLIPLARARTFARFFARRLYNRFDDDSVYFSAAAIAFNLLVTILPLALLMFTLSGLAFQGSEELRVIIREWMVDAGPLVPEGMVRDLQSTLSSASGAGITGLLGVITLLWLVSRLFGTIRTAFDRVFDVPEGRNPILGKLFDFLLALLVSISLFSASVMTTLALLVRDSPAGQIAGQWPLVGSLIGTGSARILGWVFVTLLYFMLFWAAPNRRVSLRQAGAATVLAALLSHVGTKFYLWTISRPDWGVVYGSLATVMATFLWVYWICVMLLASAEISQILHEWLKVRRSLRLVKPAAV